MKIILEKFKTIYSLKEIKENGYQVNADIPQVRKCPYCNKDFEPKGVLNPINNTISVFILDEKCDCDEFLKKEKENKEKREKQLLEDFENYRKQEINKKVKRLYGLDFITNQFKRQTLENFIVNSENAKTKLAAQKFLEKYKDMKKGIIFVGKNGTGKTHISTAICNELIKENVPVIFGTLTELLDKYKECYKNYTDGELTKLYSKVDLLVIDDLGVETMNEWMLSKLFVIVNERMKNELPIIITTNYDIDQLKKRLTIPSKVCETTNSIISRLCYMCYRVECKGKDYRIYK